MGLMEIELAKLDYHERIEEAERRRAALRRAERLRKPGGRTRKAKVDFPVFGFRLGGFRYRLWFTRTVAL